MFAIEHGGILPMSLLAIRAIVCQQVDVILALNGVVEVFEMSVHLGTPL